MRGHRLAAAAALLLTACGSTPTQVFDLSPGVPDAPAAAVPPRSGPLIWVDKPSVAGYFDRTQMVTRGAGSHISIHEFEVWSDPPADLIQRAIVDDLAHRFGPDRVMATPAAHYATPGWQVALDVIRFDVDDGGGNAALDARWTLLAGSSDRLAASGRERIEVPSGDAADPAKRVTALRAAVAMLASRIGDAIAAAAQRARRLGRRRQIQGRRLRSQRPHALHLRDDPGLRASGRKGQIGQRRRSVEGAAFDDCAHDSRPFNLGQKGRRHRLEIRLLHMEEWHLRRDVAPEAEPRRRCDVRKQDDS